MDWRWQQIALSAGIDAQDSRHRDRSAGGCGVYATLPWNVDARFSNLGVFSEMTVGAGQSKRWVAGLRIDRAEATDERDSTRGMMPMPNPTAGQTRQEWLGSGFLRREQDFSANTTAYLGLGHVARMPDYWELFSADNGPSGAVNAFAAVAPERTTQLDFGLQYRSDHLDAWVSAYAGRINDYILFDYQDGGMMGSTTTARNVDARIAGAEAGLEWHSHQGLKLGGTLAYAWGENRSDDRPLPQMPPLEARLSTSYEGARWSFGALLRAVSKQGRVATNEGNVVGRDLGPSARALPCFRSTAATASTTRCR